MYLKNHSVYDVLSTLGFCSLAGGLVVSKFAVTLGVILLVLSIPFRLSVSRLDWSPLMRMKGLLAVYLILFLTGLFSSDLDQALNELWIQNGLITIPVLLTIHWEQLKRRAVQIFYFMLLISLIASLVTVMFFILPVEQANEIVNDWSIFQEYPDVISKTQFGLYSPFIDRLQFAYVLAFVILTAVYMGFKRESYTYWILAAFLGLLILILGARGAQIALIIAAFPLSLYFLKWWMPEIKMVSLQTVYVVLVSFVICIFYAYQFVGPVKSRYNQMKWELEVINDGTFKDHEYWHFTTLTRIKSYEHSWTIIKSNPLTGIGVGDVNEQLLNEYSQSDLKVPVHIQNYYLYLWMCGGLFAALGFLYFQFDWLRSFASENTALLPRSYATAFSLFIFVILIFDAVMKYHMGAFGISFYYMLLTALTSQKE